MEFQTEMAKEGPICLKNLIPFVSIRVHSRPFAVENPEGGSPAAARSGQVREHDLHVVVVF